MAKNILDYYPNIGEKLEKIHNIPHFLQLKGNTNYLALTWQKSEILPTYSHADSANTRDNTKNLRFYEITEKPLKYQYSNKY